MEISPIAHYHGPFSSKFGIPRQSGLTTAEGRIVFTPEFRNADALRGLDGFNYIWLIWEFSENRDARKTPTVRPPILGGNERVGVWATRSPFRPNNLGLSSVRISGIDLHTDEGPVIRVVGADLMDGTPIFDIKPYVPHADCHTDALSGFADPLGWHTLKVEIPEEVLAASPYTEDELQALCDALSLDPRPHYQEDAERIYGLPFAGFDVRFRVVEDTLTVLSIQK
ncbi:MAG: tRNA (N6-threonylcarbamoyladenosine(37)-N6)-methyltransferase TrmO [Bacteroidaceae bacterium]|nr:tRNA (N6-threonylcarbamoyladenosine(37)-N6)-methyltransferase TrmO [Bacteroidaceae bacterium]